MAKKTVATLQTGVKKSSVKIIRAVKSAKTGAYSFKAEFVPVDKADEFLAKK